ncbi:ead/Ea22-like family protein [Citrobacter freundii]|uniref:ead/Ea22-like family protein n=1 Tax=Citrobacter freundii TaxID=546 RepID=UPI002433D5CD|nr:ead/Ea22-like family protein [Citrobacter freundii]WFV10609.1 ead/Ea22-like family protein [Citrobacter freundii]
MTALNKQALREAAEKATPGEWKRMMRNSDELMTTFHGVAIGNVFVELTTGKRDIFDAEFIAAANPATVLALLDELEAAEKRIAELESAFPDGWQFEECESEGCENGAIFNVGTGINNIHVCEKCASEERYFRLKKSALPKRLPFKFATGIGVKGE